MSLMYYNPIESIPFVHYLLDYLNYVNHTDMYIQNDRNALFFMMKSFNEANILYVFWWVYFRRFKMGFGAALSKET